MLQHADCEVNGEMLTICWRIALVGALSPHKSPTNLPPHIVLVPQPLASLSVASHYHVRLDDGHTLPHCYVCQSSLLTSFNTLNC